ncbi:hypothetical protein COY87_02870 [Candidatus Roizmanbacteria bacterium CG_4_10_14_0_8_um_filter_33_9]|uniref:Uncharacterized protein n=1 Tax=Candidatus Roizmanbacteria bacterium CG_4_10_14_0_8_um_filter_33_9 TaxID=1974826 RepID=A0A2M7QJC5_9BACT|nr:MAG: hypothetical protein COY87_02870 [Candidatus Roizmanbacteria bacterium CG_4_10_14_0_8_um_filter_33_9]
MIFFTVTHNAPVIIYGLGILYAVIHSIIKPSRGSVILLLGFILLLFGFEYDKHILEGLREQTINALITIQEHNKVRRIINIITLKAIPFLAPLLGWCMVTSGIYLLFVRKKKV